MRNKLKEWLIAIRPFGFVGTIIPTGIGAVLSYNQGIFNLRLFLLTIIPFLLVHTGTNLINDYFDYINGIDDKDSLSSSGILQIEGSIPLPQIYLAGIISFAGSLPFIIYLTFYRGPLVLIFGVLGIMAGFFYTAPPVNYKYLGLGVPSVFIFMGPVITWGTFFIQTGTLAWLPVFISLPVALLIAGVLYANEMRDLENDKRFAIRTLPIFIGFNRARYIYYTIILGSYLSLLILIICKIIPASTIITFLTLIPAYKIIKMVSRVKEAEQLKHIDIQTAQLHLHTGLLLILSLFISNYL